MICLYPRIFTPYRGISATFAGFFLRPVRFVVLTAACLIAVADESVVRAQLLDWNPITVGDPLEDDVIDDASIKPGTGNGDALGDNCRIQVAQPQAVVCATVDHQVAMAKFSQRVNGAKLAVPSYAAPTQETLPPSPESIPRPSYFDEPAVDMTVTEQLETLNQRLRELEAAKAANEEATRSIIRRSFAERGSNITDAVVFGGTLESLTFWAEDFDGVSESDIVLDTAELDFEIAVNPWVLGSLVLTYDDGQNFIFPTNEGDEAFVDRVNVRQAFITIGNTANYPLFFTTGRDVVPFGISTGDPVTDVLSIVDPLTVEVFEMQEDFLMIGFVGPTCCPPPAPTTPIPAPAPPRPMLFNPAARCAATSLLSYCPCTPPAAPLPEYLPPPSCIPPYSGAIYFFNGDTIDRLNGEDHIEHMGGTLGYRTRGVLSRGLPWSLDLDVDVTSSVFDSNFLAFEYRTFLDQIGFIPGMAAHAKTSVGPFAIVLEWNGAIDDANFIDDAGTPINMRPEAWEISVAYQLDWNEYVEVIGAQGTYLVFGYSESRDLAGVEKSVGDPPTLIRVGNVPERRFTAGVGEWVLPGCRVALEYSHAVDYGVADGGTGNDANGVFMQVTYEW